jgi:uncharacterized membrane protein YdbT with pleckstrin-like domain
MAEETLWRGNPSWRNLIGRLFAIVLVFIGVPLLAHFLATRASVEPDSAARILRAGWWVMLALVAIQIIELLLALARLKSTIYTITNQRITIERGMLSKSFSEIDLRYLDESQFQQGLADRLLGIGRITLVSSDKTLPVYALDAIENPRAVRETIRAAAYQVSQRQIFTRAT